MTDTPSELDRLMARLGRQRFIIYQFNATHHGPEVLAAVHHWGDVADVVILPDEVTACAFRTPLADAEGREVDIFDPQAVYWWFTASTVWTIRNLLELPQPAHPNAPRRLISAPGIYRIPEDARQKVLRQAPPRHRR